MTTPGVDVFRPRPVPLGGLRAMTVHRTLPHRCRTLVGSWCFVDHYGVPLGESIVMWWNFIGRNHDEIAEFRRRYQAELGFDPANDADAGKPRLFGEFPPDQPAPIPAPVLPGARLLPRG